MKVTVAICVYRTDFLAEAIKSVLCQRYEDFKILVLDDIPSGEVRHITEAFGDSRIIYHSNGQNLGMWRNMNQAFELCDTEYLNIFHDDDRQLPWMLEHETAILDSMPKVGVVVSSKHHVLARKKYPPEFNSKIEKDRDRCSRESLRFPLFFVAMGTKLLYNFLDAYQAYIEIGGSHMYP